MSLLDFLISPAAAQAAAPAGQQNSMMTLLFPLVLIGVMYFFMMRPQMKRQKEHREMLGKLAKGDEVVTSGGLTGIVRELGENFITVEIADNVPVKMQRSAIVSVLPKGTLKAH